MHEAVFEIENCLAESEIKYHSVTSRIKSVESLISKVESRLIIDPFTEVPDIVGTRIVALFLSDIQKIIDLLKKTFDISLVDNKIDDTDPRLFGYFSVHLHARIRSSFKGTRYDKIKKLPFEIQLRTIAMDAWASASHYLDYKTEADVPEDLKRDFNALSGLFYVADKHFEMFFRSREANLKRSTRNIKQRKLLVGMPLDLDVLVTFLANRYPDREKPEGSDVSELLTEIRQAGITNIEELSKILAESDQAFLEYEKKHPPIEFEIVSDGDDVIELENPTTYTATGAVRVVLQKFWEDEEAGKPKPETRERI